MPVISRFYGITIKMYLRQKEHNPPHIHAIYGECIGIFSLVDGLMFSKCFPQLNKGVNKMTHRIIRVEPLENFVISIVFQNGVKKLYDVKQLFDKFPQFLSLENAIQFKKVKVDVGGYGVSWNDDLDISAEELWENGIIAEVLEKVEISQRIGYYISQARKEVRMTQKELAEKTSIYQADISKIERGLANPSIETLQRIADGLGAELKIEFQIRKE